MRWTQLDRGTDVVAVRVRRSVGLAWFLTLAAAVAIGAWPVDVVFSILFWLWAIAAGVWLWLRPSTSPVVRDPTPWRLHRLGSVRRAGSARRPPRASRRGS